jgi:hypothetical protein
MNHQATLFFVGPPIMSWLRSIVPLMPDSPADVHATPEGLAATFTSSYYKESVQVALPRTIKTSLLANNKKGKKALKESIANLRL